MQLLDLLQQVREEHMSKDKLERLHVEFTNLYSELQLSLATLDKSEAIFFLRNKEKEIDSHDDPNGLPYKAKASRSDVEIKRMWRGSEEGLRQIEMNRWAKACEKQLSSIKHRIFNFL